MDIMAYSVSDISKASVLGVIFIITLFGNVLVAYALIKHRRVLLKNRPTYQFILNIILSDLVVGLLTIPFEFVRELLEAWIFGTVACKIIEFIEIAVSGTAVFTHALIAADRYRSLAHPHLPKLKGKVVKQMIALSWIVPAVMSSPYLYMFEVQEIHSKIICTPKAIPVAWLDKLYEGVEFAVVLLIPFIVLCWCYFHVTLIMWGRSPHIAAATFPTAHSAIIQNKKRVTRTACLVAGAFIVCWFPTIVLGSTRVVSGTEAVHRGHALYEVSMFGAFINEAINPIIYCAFDRNIKMRIGFCCIQTHSENSSFHAAQTQHTLERGQQEINVRNLDQTLSTLTRQL